MRSWVHRILTLALSAAAAGGAAGACSESGGAQTSSATHFLGECTSSCSAGLDCICGVCTRACTAGGDCTPLSPRASCIDTGGALAGCGAAAPSNICDVTCGSDADCAALADAPRCESGHCRADQADASVLPPDGGGAGGRGSGGNGAGGSEPPDGSRGAGGSEPTDGSRGAGGGAPTDGSRGAGGGAPTDGGTRPVCAGERTLPCHGTSTSTLPGVTTELNPARCTYTVQEATAGIDVPFTVIAETPVPRLTPTPLDQGGCETPDTSGLETFVEVTGAGQHYCVCDVGLCNDPFPSTFDLPAGCRGGTAHWEGVSWSGPSDTGNPKGAAFPPGDYVVKIRQAGRTNRDGGYQFFEITASMTVTITP